MTRRHKVHEERINTVNALRKRSDFIFFVSFAGFVFNEILFFSLLNKIIKNDSQKNDDADDGVFPEGGYTG